MRKRSYRAVAFQQIDLEELEQRLPDRVVVGIDIAKKVNRTCGPRIRLLGTLAFLIHESVTLRL